MSLQGTSAVTNSSVQPRRPRDIELSVRDGIVDTGRYEIEAKDDEVWVRDRHTNTWIKLWGDPHGVTSDGDKFQFHENLTFDLPDGTKVTVKTTPRDANGVAFIDSVAVLKGTQGVEINGVHDGQCGVSIGQVTRDVAALEAKYADGTVLTVGEQGQIDDLYSQKGEVIGGDKTQQWGEHLLDGLGGKSQYDFSDGDGWRNLIDHICGNSQRPGDVSIPPGRGGVVAGGGGGGGVGGAGGVGGSPGLSTNGQQIDSRLSGASSPEEVMMLIGLFLQDRITSLTDEMKRVAGQIDAQMKKNKQNPDDKQGAEAQKSLETQLTLLQFEVQKLQQLSQQFFTAATNTSKSRHDANMAIVSNYK